ncbi:hypothetical protein [Actinoplanes sp. TFC3]|uniref:YqeB family protein n=1 Tax=Actinoplanes sp. TFC3 TaxID=1710355 RepID=UPI00191C5908|nr:hypothetical protein [Actinoplanes sp. TFC3]
MWTGLPVAAAGAGWVAHLLPAQLLRIPFAPMRGPFRLVAGLPEPGALIGATGIGALLGLVLAFFVDKESLTVGLYRQQVVLSRPGVRRVVSRASVARAFREHDHLVLLGRTGKELAREPCHLRPERLAALFGSLWAEQDPYEGKYSRWVPGLPAMDLTAEALLTARQRALDKGDAEESRQLREELGRIGFVVRDVKKRQFFRETADE